MIGYGIGAEILTLFKNSDIENAGINIEITGASTLNNPKNNTVLFIKKYAKEFLVIIEKLEGGCIFLHSDYKRKTKTRNSVLVFGDNPRFDFAEALNHMVNKCEVQNEFKTVNNSIIGETAKIGDNGT